MAQKQTKKQLAAKLTQALFNSEGPSLYQQAYQHNAQFAKPGNYNTRLTPAQELGFLQWVSSKHVPFDPGAFINDYDMRGYWAASHGHPDWQPGQHFPDTYKTPYDTSFSAESRYATHNNPFVWHGNTLVDTRTGQAVFR